jgi:4-diphosphocytidyl-2-C-methyl-D-erythritol kinase
MWTEWRNDAVVVQAPAKVNLFLEVLARRADGFHEIATLMVAVSLYDTLEFKEDTSGALRLYCPDPALPTGPENLVYRAARRLHEHTGCRRGARIRLEKRIPLAAGLAGGSTDAAATLDGLNRLWDLGLGPADLARLGATIGSDVPFFFATPAAWCTGRGEIVEPVPLGRPLDLVLACPPVGLSTAAVYGGVTVPAHPQTGAAIRRALAQGQVEEVGRRLHNRLQETALRLQPQLAGLLQRLAALGSAGNLMSGSGTSVFVLCRGPEEAQGLFRQLSADSPLGAWNGERLKLFLVQSCS